jgi:hypothetical protein
MSYTEDQHKRAKSDMLGEFNKAILDAADLRKAETVARERAEEGPESAGLAPAGAIQTGEQS